MVHLHIGDNVDQIKSDKSLTEAEKRKELMALFNKAEQEIDENPVEKSTCSSVCHDDECLLDSDSVYSGTIPESTKCERSVRPQTQFSCTPEFFKRRRGPKGIVASSESSPLDESDNDENLEASQPAEGSFESPTGVPESQSTATLVATPKQRRRFLKPIYVLGGLGVIIVAYLAISYGFRSENPRLVTTSIEGDSAFTKPVVGETKPYVAITNTEVGSEEFVIMEPRNATPELAVGYDNVNGTDVVAIFEAAGIRDDLNVHGEHGIVGAFVYKGELLSRGMSKLGYCAIIDDKITLGVADNTPLFEKCVETEGYFFRQYPLVASGEVVDANAPGAYLRKALAELNGKIVVIQSKDKMTIGDFSEALKAMGVTTAIYLNGGNSISKCLNQDGTYTVLGNPSPVTEKNVNYIVWRRK